MAPRWIIPASTCIGFLLFLCGPLLGGNPAPPPQRPPGGDRVLGERIAKGIAFDGRLWVRGTMRNRGDASGGLVSFGITDSSRKVHFEGGVVDIAKSDHDLWILRQRDEDGRFVVAAWRGGHFQDLTEFERSPDDAPLALMSSASSPTVLSGMTVRYLANDETWHVVQLKGKLRSGVAVSAASPQEGESIYIGFDVGEWGGGLQRVDLKTGAVSDIERRDTKDLCAGPLNQACDPITGVIPDPQNKACVLASVGLVHLFHSNGRILRVCGTDVALVSEILIPDDKGIGSKWRQTEAFYGLAPSAEGGFWAITYRALYRFDATGKKEKEYTLPKLESVSGLHLSRALPDVIVLQTDLNWAVSTSGYTPLVVPLEGSASR
jgi:hypothetical protein